jgi:hypothetical protein
MEWDKVWMTRWSTHFLWRTICFVLIVWQVDILKPVVNLGLVANYVRSWAIWAGVVVGVVNVV